MNIWKRKRVLCASLKISDWNVSTVDRRSREPSKAVIAGMALEVKAKDIQYVKNWIKWLVHTA